MHVRHIVFFWPDLVIRRAVIQADRAKLVLIQLLRAVAHDDFDDTVNRSPC